MNKEIKQKWLEALKSGKYKRAKGHLKHIEGETVKHCCLGVLCELHHEMTSGGSWDNTRVGLYFSKTDLHDNSALVLPGVVRHWARLGGSNPVLIFTNDELRDKAREMSGSSELLEASIAEINDWSKEDDFSDVIPFIEKLL